MNFKAIKDNMNEISTTNYTVLFSYQTPVAYMDIKTGKTYRTSKKWSVTTSKHINAWLGKDCGELVHQSVLDNLLNEVK